MDEGNVKLFACLLADTPIAPNHDDLVAGVEELVGHGREIVPPLIVERVEDVRPDLVEAAVEPAVRQTLRLVPLDRRIHVAEHAVQVAARERGVRTPDDLDGAHPHNLERCASRCTRRTATTDVFSTASSSHSGSFHSPARATLEQPTR